VSRLVWNLLALSLVAGAAAAGVLLLAGDEGGGDRGQTAREAPTISTRPDSAPDSGGPEAPGGASRRATRQQVREAVEQSPRARLDPGQRRVARVVRSYVTALDRGDGAGACRLLAPGALSEVRLPRHRGECGRSLSASVGFRDPRGFPVFAGARVARIPGVVIDGAEARVTATTVTRFADRREPSVEDDVIYLRRGSGGWLIEKPGATLYRAIGVGDIPPRALAPP
jgi:hypothetical protein